MVTCQGSWRHRLGLDFISGVYGGGSAVGFMLQSQPWALGSLKVVRFVVSVQGFEDQDRASCTGQSVWVCVFRGWCSWFG